MCAFNAVKCNLKELTTKSAWVPRSAVFSTRMLGGWLHRPCDSLARSVFPSCWVLLAIFFTSRPSPRPVGFFFPFLWCGGSWLGCAVVPVMGALFQSRGWLPIVEAPGYFRHPTSILAMQLLILGIHVPIGDKALSFRDCSVLSSNETDRSSSDSLVYSVCPLVKRIH